MQSCKFLGSHLSWPWSEDRWTHCYTEPRKCTLLSMGLQNWELLTVFTNSCLLWTSYMTWLHLKLLFHKPKSVRMKWAHVGNGQGQGTGTVNNKQSWINDWLGRTHLFNTLESSPFAACPFQILPGKSHILCLTSRNTELLTGGEAPLPLDLELLGQLLCVIRTWPRRSMKNRWGTSPPVLLWK